MTLVVLEPPLTRSGPWRPPGSAPATPIATAARYMRSRGMGRWHRPRSGARRGPERATYHLWCGQMAHESHGLITAGAVPAGEKACGTCEGRAIGAGQDSWPVPGLPDLLFKPRRLTRPARCPGSRSQRLYADAGSTGRVLRCLVCGELIPGRASGGPYNSIYGPVNHEPGPGLVAGCPFHAWSYLVVADGLVVCECTVIREAAS